MFVLPYLIVFVLFLIFPLIYGLWISLHNWNLISEDHQFNGLQNYFQILKPGTAEHDLFFHGLINTLKFVVFSVPFLLIFGLGLALLLNSLPDKVKGFFRTIFFIPYSISVSIVAVLWLWMLDTNSGLVNQMLSKFGLGAIPWLTSESLAWFSIVLATLWWTVGFNMVIFINALNDVSEEMYEAADIDGATSVDKFRFITLPTIKPVLLFVLVTSTIASFNVYGQPYLMTRGGPGDSTEVLLMGIVKQAFTLREIGSASAMAVLMTLIIICISIFQFIFLNRKEKVS
ncbi:sugar ABC transporter permease [Macrococcus lamae]|uniref:Sugar ABC transporter permease n=1 Tax=Macrococcus lamae TaxID=198484 RepID=A0A4R6BS79_9STAP|nr:sugar ABC transporter permease [Macrococcus lamae]